MFALRADLLDFVAAPPWGEAFEPGGTAPPAAVRWRPDHWLLVGDDGRIAAVQSDAPDPRWRREEHPGRLLLPGFVDTHVHSPQLGVRASWGTGLLDWLDTYTFPAEGAWADPEVAARGSEQFLDALLAHGTTAAAVFPTVHRHSAAALFEGAARRGMRVVAGKVLMDRHAPDFLRDDVAGAERDCVDLIDRWHGHARCSYAVTVRFAPTSTPQQLAMAGSLCRADPTLYMQTHVAESRDEVRWVASLYPQARSYLDVYASHGLLHRRSILAHGIWLDDHDRAAVRAAGAQLAFCPSSNLFLGSGLFDWRAAHGAGCAVSVASDVGGGTHLVQTRTLAEAYKVQALAGQRLTAWSALHAATLGAAAALGLEHEIGSLEPGRMADIALWDWSAGALDGERMDLARNLHEKAFAWMTLADERHLVGTWVAGRRMYARMPS
ncbi:MAG: guanine deaminase [Pseudomonadota bacterium]|jgi:guanine deaminase|nr:guanine deaminase [Rubrivivax sp.]MCA3256952.1 guanine deaminase [Rubrivivax sp.]MCE2913387.1 guanine deaminase [Rubrivivax sp.]MCZ8032812.1 guanine deaminase [Rubrivivax sp.]